MQDETAESDSVSNGNTFDKLPRTLEIEVFSSDKKAAISVGGTQVTSLRNGCFFQKEFSSVSSGNNSSEQREKAVIFW